MASDTRTASRVPGSHEPTRTCIGCRQRCEARTLLRLAVTAGRVAVRRGGSAGRGAWVHPTEVCVQQAIRTRAFSRAFRGAVDVPPPSELLAAARATVSGP